MATENKDQEPETASATLADGMHFVGNIEGFRIDLDAACACSWMPSARPTLLSSIRRCSTKL